MRVVLFFATAVQDLYQSGILSDLMGGRVKHTACQAPQFEDEDRGEEGPFQGKIFVCFAPRGLKGGERHEESRSIPAHLV